MDTTLNYCYYSLKASCYFILDILNWTVSTTNISHHGLFLLCINIQEICKSFAKVFAYYSNNKMNTKIISYSVSSTMI
ncbi:hypothetical protein MNBD_GAMMA22-2377 [hydrothermal vent metagenome]|uniref:Uncharacterized protein n=1 Tax=hydrothermal vent metagenome TaxID=652676 RepID=A0A3B1AHL4_9ZZZZ